MCLLLTEVELSHSRSCVGRGRKRPELSVTLGRDLCSGLAVWIRGDEVHLRFCHTRSDSVWEKDGQHWEQDRCDLWKDRDRVRALDALLPRALALTAKDCLTRLHVPVSRPVV